LLVRLLYGKGISTGTKSPELEELFLPEGRDLTISETLVLELPGGQKTKTLTFATWLLIPGKKLPWPAFISAFKRGQS